MGLPRPASMLSMVRVSKLRVSASFSCESPSSVRASRTAMASNCFMSCIIIHLKGGLSCTTAGEVQLAEMSEPFFTALLGLVILNQVLSRADLSGGILVIIGLLILERENIRGKYGSKNNRV